MAHSEVGEAGSLHGAVGADVGVRGPHNEDSAYASARLLAIADGMGGHAHGEVASAITIGALADLDRGWHPGTDPVTALADATAEALRRLTERAEENPKLAGMGTTLTAVLLDGACLTVAHVGDSRGYLFRAGTLTQITTDHTLVQSLVEEGQLSATQAADHPRRSMLIRALQAGGSCEPDLARYDACDGDRLLLCSDGISGVVPPELLTDTLADAAEPADAVARLIAHGARLASQDNMSCAVADVRGGPADPTVHIAGAAAEGPARPSNWLTRLIGRRER